MTFPSRWTQNYMIYFDSIPHNYHSWAEISTLGTGPREEHVGEPFPFCKFMSKRRMLASVACHEKHPCPVPGARNLNKNIYKNHSTWTSHVTTLFGLRSHVTAVKDLKRLVHPPTARPRCTSWALMAPFGRSDGFGT